MKTVNVCSQPYLVFSFQQFYSVVPRYTSLCIILIGLYTASLVYAMMFFFFFPVLEKFCHIFKYCIFSTYIYSSSFISLLLLQLLVFQLQLNIPFCFLLQPFLHFPLFCFPMHHVGILFSLLFQFANYFFYV